MCKFNFSVCGIGLIIMWESMLVVYGYWMLYFVECVDFMLLFIIFDVNCVKCVFWEVLVYMVKF